MKSFGIVPYAFSKAYIESELFFRNLYKIVVRILARMEPSLLWVQKVCVGGGHDDDHLHCPEVL